MRKRLLSIKTLVLTFLFCLVVLAGLTITYGTVAEPGSEQDPVITLSYIEQIVIPRINEAISEKIEEYKNLVEQIKISLQNIESRISAIEAGDKLKFKVVSVKAGKTLIGDSGTELILRMGSATIISSEKGGLADVTGGADVILGNPMPANHLLIVPLGDGRGFEALTDVLVMVKGQYEIKD